MSKTKEELSTRPRTVFEMIVEGGHQLFVSTVRFHYIGTVFEYHEKIQSFELVKIRKVFDSGSLEEAFGNGNLENVEYFPPELTMLIPIGSCTDIVPWVHD